MQTYVGTRATIKIFDNNDRAYLTTFNDSTLKALADISFAGNPIDGATEILDNSITGTKLVDGTVTVDKLAPLSTIPTLLNDTYLKGRNFADNADLNMIKINISDNLEHGTYWEGLRLGNNKIFGSRTVGGADANWMKENLSDQWEYLATAYTQALLPKATTTYDLGGASNVYSKGYLTNLRLGVDSTSRDFFEKGTWTPRVYGGTIAGTGTYPVQQGYYYREGPLLWLTCSITLSNHTGTGSMLIDGMPYNPGNAAAINGQIYVGTLYSGNLTLTGSCVDYQAIAVGGVSNIQLGGINSAAGNTAIAMDTSCQFSFQISYIID